MFTRGYFAFVSWPKISRVPEVTYQESTDSLAEPRGKVKHADIRSCFMLACAGGDLQKVATEEKIQNRGSGTLENWLYNVIPYVSPRYPKLFTVRISLVSHSGRTSVVYIHSFLDGRLVHGSSMACVCNA